MRIISFLIILFLFWNMSSGCKRFLDIPAPSTSLIDVSVFADSATASAAVLGLYHRAMQNTFGVLDGGGTYCAALQTDELVATSQSAVYQEFYSHNLTPSNRLVGSFWTELYQLVYQSNAILEQLQASTDLSASLVAKLSGEAYLMRGVAYFRLQNWYGAVPLALTADFRTNATLAQTKEATVLEQVATDWRLAASLLPDSYPGGVRTRPTRYAALSLLSRVYLYQGKWAAAEEVASEVINSSVGFHLAETPSQAFSISSPEVIWQLRPVMANMNTSVATLLAQLGGTVPSFGTYRSTFWETMLPDDRRLRDWVHSFDVQGKRYWQPVKYRSANTALGIEYLVMVRLAEVLLNRAEARLQQSKLEPALEDINRIRERAGIPTLTDLGQLLQALQQERQWELQVEQDFRWTDLKRWGLLESVIQDVKPGVWKPRSARLPIPQVEINNNKQLLQNEGY